MIIVNVGGGGTSIYTSDGTLSSNRVINCSSHNLTFNLIGDLKYNSKTSGYLMGYYDIGNGRPEFVIDSPNGGQSWFRIRNNGTDVRNTVTIGNSVWDQCREWQVRSILTNNIQMIRDVEGRWLFSNDASGLDTPDSDTRIKIASDGLPYALKTDSKVKMTGLPTSNVGLSIGDLYVDTAANILANGDLILARKV